MLVVQDLRKYFGEVKAVDRVNFKIEKGEIVSLVGPNGAGKTTLVNLISGYLNPDGGKIVFLGKDITYASPPSRVKLGIGRSFQIVSVFENNTVLDNVRTPLFSAYRKTRSLLKIADAYTDITNEALRILETFGLLDKADLYPPNLSEGDRKILDVAVAFALKPKLLLLDEPTSGVATRDKFRIMDILVSVLRKEQTSALIIEHDMDIVSSYSDRVMVMHEGKLLAEGKPSEVMEDKNVKAVLFGV
ncbi:MAG: ABC transporter ATP-binding protein [Candidatus Hecatellaceae archaeon]